jgi:hypothetical protein
MRLRGSSAEVNLDAVIGSKTADPGIAWGTELHRFIVAVLRGETEATVAAARVIETGVGVGALLDAAGVLAFFNGINRVADATGIEVDRHVVIPAELDLSHMRRQQ